VLDAAFKAGTAKLGGLVKTKLRNVSSQRLWEPHFRPEKRLQDMELEQRRMEFPFPDAGNCTLMNPENFEQITVPNALLGPAIPFMEPGMELSVEFFEGQPISVALPDVMEARVAHPMPATHSQQDTVGKDATLEMACTFVYRFSSAPAR